jgi:hypothetical protein
MATTAANSKGTTKPRTTTTRPTTPETGPVQVVRHGAERALDVPVGAALLARERVTDAVEPWTSTSGRERELKSLRTQVTRELSKFERRGGQARRKATQRVRSTRTRVERELKARRREVERTVKQNRTKVTRTVKRNRGKAEDALTKAQDRVSELV